MDRKERYWAPRIFFILLFASACVCITAFAPRNTFGQVFKLPDSLLQAMVYAQVPSQKSRLKIMPLGDSITFGPPDPSYGGYRTSRWGETQRRRKITG
jgi:hypothetical protein